MYPSFRVFVIEIFSESSEIKNRSVSVLEPNHMHNVSEHSIVDWKATV
jgi:hypothetical protein